MKKVLAFVLALVMVLSMAACGNDANKQGDAEKEVTKIRLAHDYSPETANSIGMENFAKLVAEKSGGTIEIDIYSNGELSGRNSQTTFKLLQSGDIDIGNRSAPQHRRMAAVLSALLLPRQRQRLCRLSG